MDKLKWLDKYSGQTTDELIALEGKFRTDSIVVAFEEALSKKLAKNGKSALSEEELIILSVEAFERDVNNDGYDGFFTNNSEFAPIIVNSLTRVNCRSVAELTSRAMSCLGIESENSQEAIDHAMAEENEQRTKILHECDNEYYTKAGDLAGPLLIFIKANRKNIIIN
jgi:hypothetical protein